MIYVTRDNYAHHHGPCAHVMWVGEKPVFKDGYWNRMNANGFHWMIGTDEAAESLGIEVAPGEIKEYELVEKKP